MASEKPGLGLRPIAGIMANLGHVISDQTVGNVRRRNGLPPAPERKRTTPWSVYLAALAESGQALVLKSDAEVSPEKAAEILAYPARWSTNGWIQAGCPSVRLARTDASSLRLSYSRTSDVPWRPHCPPILKISKRTMHSPTRTLLVSAPIAAAGCASGSIERARQAVISACPPKTSVSDPTDAQSVAGRDGGGRSRGLTKE